LQFVAEAAAAAIDGAATATTTTTTKTALMLRAPLASRIGINVVVVTNLQRHSGEQLF
jgi:hypothetical protein